MAQNNAPAHAPINFNAAAAAPATDSPVNASVVVFDRKFWTKIPPVGIELRILYDGAQSFTLSVTVFLGSHTLNWTKPINGDVTWRIGLVAGLGVELDLANWSATGAQLLFDLLVKVTGPLGVSVTVFSDHIAVAIPHGSEMHALAQLSLADLQQFTDTPGRAN